MRKRLDPAFRSLPVTLLLLAAATGGLAQSPPEMAPEPPAAAAAAADPLAECLPQKGIKKREMDEFCLLRQERIGPLHIGLDEKQALAAISCPVSKGKESFLAATGDYGQKLSFPACGLEIDMVSSSKGGPKSIAAIVVAQPSTLTTSRGIGIGASEDAVIAAYQPFLDKGATRRGKTIVAGSIYGGLIISIAQGKVSEIFLGAVAE